MTIIILYLFSVLLTLEAQEISFSFQQGLAQYEMTDLKEFNVIAAETLQFEAKQVDNFPGYWFYRPSLMVGLGKLNLGINYTYYSTGSSLSYGDYSGTYMMNQKIDANAIGVSVDYQLYKLGGVAFCAGADLGYLDTRLELTEDLMLADTEVIDEGYEFSSYGFYMEPHIAAKYLYKQWAVSLQLGYMQQLYSSRLAITQNENIYLKMPDSGKELKPDWSGLQLGLNLSYCINFE